MYNENNRQCIFCEHQLKISSDYIKHYSKCKTWFLQISRIILNNHIFTVKHVINSSSFFLYNSFSFFVEIHAAWTESESDNTVINNTYDILRIREKFVRDTLKCKVEYLIILHFYMFSRLCYDQLYAEFVSFLFLAYLISVNLSIWSAKLIFLYFFTTSSAVKT